MMDTATAARVLGGRLQGENVPFTRVTTDSRTLVPGDLFVALRGERFDGHAFVAAAFERGAVAALVSAEAATSGRSLVAVPDTLAALAQLAGHWRGRFAIPLVAVVGSNGKTTVKEMIAAILRAHWGEVHVHATAGNLNNAIGLPLTLLGLRETHRAAVVELGMNHPGETRELAAIARPTIAVINNAQREHQEFMRSVADVAAEHAALVQALGVDGVAVLNADDAFVGTWRSAVPPHARVLDFALAHDAAVRGTAELAATESLLELSTPAGRTHVHLRAAGLHNVANALAATAAGIAAGVSLTAVVRGLEAFRPVAGRLVAMTGKNGVHVIDDSYNANPDSVGAAIAVLASAPPPRWLVLGDMGEVGSEGPRFHREAGEAAREAGIERLLTSGVLAAHAADAFGPGAAHHDAVESLVAELAASAAPGTTVLVKGSRFMRMERVVAALTGERAAGAGH